MKSSYKVHIRRAFFLSCHFAPPLIQGALDEAAIRVECPQFRILVIGKAKLQTIHDAEGKEPKQQRPRHVLHSWYELNQLGIVVVRLMVPQTSG